MDFVDIGWNEWIISFKFFDVYYCVGVCEFFMFKVGVGGTSLLVV